MVLFYKLDVGISGFSFSINSTGKEFAHSSLNNIFAKCRHLTYSPLRGFDEHFNEGWAYSTTFHCGSICTPPSMTTTTLDVCGFKQIGGCEAVVGLLSWEKNHNFAKIGGFYSESCNPAVLYTGAIFRFIFLRSAVKHLQMLFQFSRRLGKSHHGTEQYPWEPQSSIRFCTSSGV